MNLKQQVRQALLEQERKYEYGCVLINLDANKDEWQKVQDLVEEEDIYEGDGKNGGFGREMKPHITVLFGVHTDVPNEDVEALAKESSKPEIELQKISTFENSQPFDVLKFDVKSDDLHKLNKKFKSLPHTSSFPNYHPHATICYLKKGTAKKYEKKLANVEPIFVKPDTIEYSKPDGTKIKYDFK